MPDPAAKGPSLIASQADKRPQDGNEGGASGRSPGPESLYKGDVYRLLVESVRDYAIFALDPRGYILTWSAGAQLIKGYTANEAIGRHFSMFYPHEAVAEGFPEFELRTAANTGRFEDYGWRLRKDGSRFWANVVITVLRDASGTLVGFAKVTRDITERREAEDALRESEERFRLLVEGVRDYAIFMLDPSGRITTWNIGAERIKGYRAREIIGQHFSIFYPPEDIASHKPERELEIATREGQYEEEGWRLRKDGTPFWANVLITAIRNRAGELVGFAKVTRDLTERRAAQLRALEDASRIAAEESANRTKSQFLAAMSHELRTPLNAIGGYAELLGMGIAGPINEQQREHIERIRRSQSHLLGIINDLLNYSRIEAGQLSYDLGPVPLRDVLHDVTIMVAPQARTKGLRFEESECSADVVAWADRAKVEQILINLLSNAVKFTNAGGLVSMGCRATGDGRAAVTVSDTGVGVPEDKLHAIFEPFVQVGRSLTSQPEGTGLGLAISRDLARGMAGDLSVESRVGEGSTFLLTLPLGPA